MIGLQDESRQPDELLISSRRLLRFVTGVGVLMDLLLLLIFLLPLASGVFFLIREGLGTHALLSFTMAAVLIVTALVPISEKRINPNKLPKPVVNDGSAERWSRAEALERFGPNGLEVRSFLCRLPLLHVEHWEMIRRTQIRDGESLLQTMIRSSRRPWPPLCDLPDDATRFDAVHHAMEAAEVIAGEERISPLNLEDARYWSSRTGRSAGKTTFWPAVLDACVALVHRDLLPRESFVELYRPFEPVIPAATMRP